MFPNFPSICRLNLKFECSAMHMYFCSYFGSVRNAIDDLGFLDQVIGIVLRQIWVYERCVSGNSVLLFVV